MKKIITTFIISLAALLFISCSEKNTDTADTNANTMDHSAHTAHKAGSEIIDLMHISL